MSVDNKIWQLAEAYLDNRLADAELSELTQKLSADAVFAAEFQEAVNFIRTLNNSGAHKRFGNTLKEISRAHNAKTESPKHETRTIPVKAHYWRTAAVAAGIALLTSLTTFWVVQHNNKKIASQYSLLRRDLEKYKRSQNQLIDNITKQAPAPAAEASYTGTGFALTNDGYLVTNYHVTEGADSVYIQDSEGKYYKATVVNYDQQNDVAILKVEDKRFRFGKGDVPYTLAPAKRKIGARVYSLGFPEDEITYNEGYISAKNGYEGDSMQYKMQIESKPGQSGAPVIDINGNIIAIVTGKETGTPGTTYAVSTKAVLQLLRTSPNGNTINLPKANKLGKLTLEQQVEKLEKYTCSVSVYKK